MEEETVQTGRSIGCPCGHIVQSWWCGSISTATDDCGCHQSHHLTGKNRTLSTSRLRSWLIAALFETPSRTWLKLGTPGVDLPSRAAGFKYIQQRAAKKINRYLSPLQPDYNGDICNEYHHPELSDANLSNELLHTHKYSRHTIATRLRRAKLGKGFGRGIRPRTTGLPPLAAALYAGRFKRDVCGFNLNATIQNCLRLSDCFFV